MPVADRLGRIVLLLLLFAAWQLGEGKYLQAKAWLAQQLLRTAWQQTRDGGDRIAPWPWADTWPVARLRVPGRKLERLVLAGDSGNALAFGPGHALASSALGGEGLAVIGGHRDTHFAFLQHLLPGEQIQLQLPDRSWREYRVETIEVVDSSRQSLARDTEVERLLLVTCYPFDALRANGPLRYVIAARPESALQMLSRRM